jgi:hypothetical protein
MSRARASCLSEASASTAISRFSSAMTRTCSRTSSAFFNGGVPARASPEGNSPSSPPGRAPPSLSHLASASSRCWMGSGRLERRACLGRAGVCSSGILIRLRASLLGLRATVKPAHAQAHHFKRRMRSLFHSLQCSTRQPPRSPYLEAGIRSIIMGIMVSIICIRFSII